MVTTIWQTLVAMFFTIFLSGIEAIQNVDQTIPLVPFWFCKKGSSVQFLGSDWVSYAPKYNYMVKGKYLQGFYGFD